MLSHAVHSSEPRPTALSPISPQSLSSLTPVPAGLESNHDRAGLRPRGCGADHRVCKPPAYAAGRSNLPTFRGVRLMGHRSWSPLGRLADNATELHAHQVLRFLYDSCLGPIGGPDAPVALHEISGALRLSPTLARDACRFLTRRHLALKRGSCRGYSYHITSEGVLYVESSGRRGASPVSNPPRGSWRLRRSIKPQASSPPLAEAQATHG